MRVRHVDAIQHARGRPNDYERVLKDREQRRIEAEKEVERLRELERQQAQQVCTVQGV